MVFLVPKVHLAERSLTTQMSEKCINNMLKYFAKLQVEDEEPGIRTNTTICLAKISNFLTASVLHSQFV